MSNKKVLLVVTNHDPIDEQHVSEVASPKFIGGKL